MTFLIVRSWTTPLFVRAQKNWPIIWQKARIVMMESDSFNNERSGKLPIALISRGMPVKASTACLKKMLLIYALIFYPQETITGIDLSGVIVIASTGQYILHK
ncbi:MAG: hypothetical protein V1706_03305 [Pseudomonadota bacterium]